MTPEESLNLLKEGNRRYLTASATGGDISAARRQQTAEEGQHPHAVVVACSDARVIPEAIFSCSLGDIVSVRLAGNVLDARQIGSIQFAAQHLGCALVVVLGHTRCDTVAAAFSGRADAFLRAVTEDIRKACGPERDPEKAVRLNIRRGVQLLREAFRAHPQLSRVRVVGALYDTESGEVRWM